MLFLKKNYLTLFHYWKGSFWTHFGLETFWGLCFRCPVVSLHRSLSLVFIISVRGSDQRIIWWSLFLHKSNMKVCHIRGWENVLADALSIFSVSTEGVMMIARVKYDAFKLLHQSHPPFLHFLFVECRALAINVVRSFSRCYTWFEKYGHLQVITSQPIKQGWDAAIVSEVLKRLHL